MEEIHFLKDLVAVYGFGVLVVYVFQKLRQSPIVGFLVAGLLVGPYGLSLVSERESVEVLAEIGVMLLLFSLGLEFSLKKFAQMRYVVLGTGSLQVISTVLMVLGIAVYAGLMARQGVLFGFLVALSSTAIVLKLLAERGELDSIHGRIALGILIFQDFCVVPMIVIVPLLASPESIWLPLAEALAKAALMIAAVLVLARYLFPAFLEQIVRTRSKELFVISCIFMFLGTAWVTSEAGFSLALGSFLAGLILSESEYSHQIFADIRPFRDSLNSLFFISIGMLMNPTFVWEHAGSVLSVVGAIVLGKGVLITAAVLASGFPMAVGLLVGLSMAQIGEFSFILLRAGSEAGLFAGAGYQIMISAAVITMLLTPALFFIARRLVSMPAVSRWGNFLPGARTLSGMESSAPQKWRDHVIVCGFGVSGKNIARVLRENKIVYVVLELNAQKVREERKEGEPIYFGDCTDSQILDHAGIRQARVLILAISDPFSSRRAVATARALNHNLVILVRTKYMADIDVLYNLGATEVVAEEFEASIELMTRILRVYHLPRALVASEIKAIREQRYGIFRRPRATVPRLRLSEELDVYTETFEVTDRSPMTQKPIAETGIRRDSGAFILGIIRDGQTLNNPGPGEIVRPGDRLILSGTKEQLNRAMELLEGGT